MLAAEWATVSLWLRLDLLATAAFTAIVASLACNSGRVTDLMANRALYFLGEVSFSIDLIDYPSRPLALHLLMTIHPAPCRWLRRLAAHSFLHCWLFLSHVSRMSPLNGLGGA